MNKFLLPRKDNINDYYSQKLKKARLSEIKNNQKILNGLWQFYETSIENIKALKEICIKNQFDVIVHLAAQAGVRYSLKNPESYINSNLVGFGNILEICKENKIKNFIFASSSSVYGMQKKLPFSEDDNVDNPISLYAATKKSNELMAYSYSHLYQIPTTDLRFFTVYGPWGRPDMAPMLFAKAILSGRKIKVFNHGKMVRDFTYIDDVVERIYKCCSKPATPDLKSELSPNIPPYRIFNVGNSQPIQLMDFIDILEKKLGKKAIKEYYDIQPGDVIATYADHFKFKKWIGFEPKTSFDVGIEKFSQWYLNNFKVCL